MIQLKIALLLIVLIILLSLVFLGVSVIATGGKCYEPPVPAKNAVTRVPAVTPEPEIVAPT